MKKYSSSITNLFYSSLIIALVIFSTSVKAQYIIKGSVQDTTGMPLPGSIVKITSISDSLSGSTDEKGFFTIRNVKSFQFKLTASFLGFDSFSNQYQNNNNTVFEIPAIQLKTALNILTEVVVTDVTAVKITEDTVSYNAASFPVREGDAVEEILKKLPGASIDKNGNVIYQGETITKVRVNGKDFFGADVATAIKNLPADIVKNIQFIDDYGDKAKLTGVKTGEPEKILNINIQEDKKRGYFVRAGAGAGNADRFNTNIRANSFKGERQVSFDGTINNTNMRGGSNDGITNTTSAGMNYRNEWNKRFSGDGGYNFRKKDNNTHSSIFTQNFLQEFTRLEDEQSISGNENLDHSFWGNLEYKPDTMNYLKFSPNVNFNSSDNNNSGLFNINQPGITTLRENRSSSISSSFNASTNIFYNHKFQKRGRNFSLNTNLNFSRGENSRNVKNDYKITESGLDSVRLQNQLIDNTNDNFRSWFNFSYLEPIATRSFVELNYTWNYSATRSSRDTRDIENGISVSDPDLSNQFEYQFISNRMGLNYRFEEKKYNYTLGINAEPAVLKGQNLSRNVSTRNETLNWLPSARFVYRFSKQKSLNLNYNGRNVQPTFIQLQPLTDNSNLQNTVIGNPNLNPEFIHSLNMRYNQSDWKLGHTLFANLSYNQTQNKIVTTKTLIANSINQITSYTNTNGFYNVRGNYNYSKPFSERKFTLSWEGGASFNNNVAFIDNQRNIARNIVVNQGLEFEIDIEDQIDIELRTSYSINRTQYSQKTFTDRQTNNMELGIEGRNYFFKDLTLGYDFTKNINRGFNNSSIKNPAILHVYTEYRFLKGNMGTIGIQAFDLFNQNAGITRDVFDNIIVDRQIDRLGRYFMLSFNLRLNKFSGPDNQKR